MIRYVIEDARNGRVYLPTETLRRHGLEGCDLTAKENRERVFGATRELIEAAERYYASAGVGLSELPVRSAWAIAAARRVYRDISRKVLARGAGAWDTRTVTSKWQKAAGVGIAGLEAVSARPLLALGRPEPRAGLWTPPFLRGD